MANKVSENFMEAFSSGVSSCRMTCCCGRDHYDWYNDGYDWEPGELEGLKKSSKAIGHEGSVSAYEVEGKVFVWGCPCEGGLKYEAFIIENRHEIAKFLNAYIEKIKFDIQNCVVKDQQ